MTKHLSEKNVLNVWGGGQLLAFSGCDGPTDYEGGLCARTAFEGVGLSVVLPATCKLHFSEGAPKRVLLGGDFFDLVTDAGRTRGAFLDAHHLLIEGPCSVRDAMEGIAVERAGDRVLIAPKGKLDAARVKSNLSEAIRDRQQWLGSIPIPSDVGESRRRGLMKALSIMKTQVCTAEGRIRRRWTTPDRWPHRAMWLWDSAVHAVGWRHIDVGLAREMAEAVFDGRYEDGMVPHMSSPDASSGITQAPVLGLAAMLVEQRSPERSWIERMYPKLADYVRWDLANRDSDRAGLLEWHIEGNPNCRSGESGMDNSTRFDSAQQLDAPDFNAYVAHECEILADFADQLGRRAEASAWRDEHQRLCRLINERLWDEEHGLYVDCVADTGEQTGILSAAAFLPMICGAPSQEQAQRLAAHLEDPHTFGTPLPVPTISAGQPEHYSKDMWRGPVWVNVNWLIAYGFSRYGFHNAAAVIRQKTLEAVERYYEEYGVFFEFYDDRDAVPPPQLMRKGSCDPTHHMHQVIHDYGWTATLYLDMAMAEAGRGR